MKLWKMNRSSYFDHEKMNLVEKNVSTPAIKGRTLPRHVDMVHVEKTFWKNRVQIALVTGMLQSSSTQCFKMVTFHVPMQM
jgi:hypothetical protein